MTSRRKFLELAGTALAASALPRVACAQQWPARPIRAIVPFSAGSTIDILGRIVAEPLSAALGQPIIVDNRGGAGGSIGAAVVAKAEPDGHTILIHASAHSVAPAAYPNAPYNAARDFAAVANFGVVPNVIVISPAKGIKTLRQLADAAKKGTMSFASAGVASASHWGTERFRISAGFSATHVPFKGGIEALTDVMAGRVDFMSVGVSSAMPFISQGRLIALGVCTRKRSSALPDVPTTIEAGFPDSDYTYWNGLLVPAKTPRAVVDRLHAETMKALKLASVLDKLKPLGVEPMPLTPREFDAMIAKEIEINIALVKAAGLKFN
ncbi:MAG: extracytoplasmic binding receptor [Betaproteobacteria bacterium]|nr:extracytoplasmic binding receptor [Betaproteobacteria bacterium]